MPARRARRLPWFHALLPPTVIGQACSNRARPGKLAVTQHPSTGGLHERLQSASSARPCRCPATRRRRAGQRPWLKLPPAGS